MNVAFHLYFPDEAATRKAAETLAKEGYEVETRPSADGVEWIALVSATVADNEFDAAEHKLESFARANGGRFDGYEEGG